MRNPKYKVCVGNLLEIDAHNTHVSELLENGYSLWGHPIQHGDLIAQTVYVKDEAPAKPIGATGKRRIRKEAQD